MTVISYKRIMEEVMRIHKDKTPMEQRRISSTIMVERLRII